MPNDFSSHIVMIELTNETFFLEMIEGWKAIFMLVSSTSTASATITGKAGVTIGGKAATGIEIVPDGSFRAVSGENDSLEDLTIVAPANCYVKIALTKSPYIIINEESLSFNT